MTQRITQSGTRRCVVRQVVPDVSKIPRPFETLDTIHKTTQRLTPERSSLPHHRYEKLKSRSLWLSN